MGCHAWNLRAALRLAMLLTILVASGGCGGNEAESEVADSAPPIDPRYASAESLLAEFNRFTTRDPVDVLATLDLFYAETPWQTRMITLTRLMAPAIPLERAAQERFKASIDPSMSKSLAAKPNGPAAITKREGDRVTATYKDDDGEVETLQLVRYRDRWWISGYTMEHDPDLKDINEDAFEFADLTMTPLAAVSPGLTSRITGGEFKSIAEARQALQAAMIQQMTSDPDRMRRLQELMARNPNLKPKPKP